MGFVKADRGIFMGQDADYNGRYLMRREDACMSGRVVISMNTHGDSIYHRPGCYYEARIWPKGKKFVKKGEAQARGYRPCKYCCGICGYYRSHGDLFAKWSRVLHMEFTCLSRQDRLCVRTQDGLWQIRQNCEGIYALYHLNHFRADVPTRELANRSYHRQNDVPETGSVGQLIGYIYRHDQAMAIIKDDYHKLPQDTRQQKIYYQQARDRERRRSIRRVDKWFRRMDKKRGDSLREETAQYC